MNKSKKGSAIALALIFATVLLMMGLAYAKLTDNNKKQTVQIDERVKLDYLANSLTELALLKFQLFPTDFYACSDAYKANNNFKITDGGDTFTPLDFFSQGDSVFKMTETLSKSSFNDMPVKLQIASMSILTNNKLNWKSEILRIEATAEYTDQFGKPVNKTAKRVVNINDKCYFGKLIVER